MADTDDRRLERHFIRWERRLPNRLARLLRGLRQPALKPVRVVLGILLTAGGTLGFLPLLGFWMLPLGLVLLAQDFPALKRRVGRLLVRIRHHRRRVGRRWR